MIKTELCEEEDRLVMYFEGRLDTPDADKVKKDMKGLFLALLQEGRKNGCNVSVTGLSPYIRRVFDETGFARLFKLD